MCCHKYSLTRKLTTNYNKLHKINKFVPKKNMYLIQSRQIKESQRKLKKVRCHIGKGFTIIHLETTVLHYIYTFGYITYCKDSNILSFMNTNDQIMCFKYS